MKEVWFFLSMTNTGYIKRSRSYDSFEKAYEARREVLNDPYEDPITSVMKGYERA